MYGILVPFLSPALLELGYSKQEVGFIVSGTFLCQMLLPTLGGRISDKYLSADRTILYGAWLMFAAAFAMYFESVKSVLFVGLLVVFSIARSPMVSLQDALAMQTAGDDPKGYSYMRVMGSVGFALAAVAFGYIVEHYGIMTFFPGMALACFAFAVQSLFLPKEKKRPATEGMPGFWKRLDRTWWLWLTAIVINWFCFGPFNYGFTLYLTEQGIPDSIAGWMWGIGVFAEIVVFL